ncbi:50S ribosomal protein L16 [Candidatus Peregrinibacteria bacterium CG_4_10_14_0_2_um_filter_38_24]|nr:MAG: 50S ribosomal protein L16 [Candidatus Peregrinibacteria bacterium CG_4_10_14_0_2_um_filter_38_24]PJC38616.1 MAG: 50S ribosomal protein L16 [Candidatus Peregrinibacteria bacterium CG_4_9_14_0_2_um_filter_38_9]
MLAPRKQKHRKAQRGRSDTKGISMRGNKLSFGTYGLKAMQAKEITARQLEAARRSMTRYIKRGGKIWITVFPHKPLTKKAQEVPMGSGKGAPELFVCPVLPGRILFEMEGIDEATARAAMKLAAYKLPIKCKFISTTLK